MCCLLGYGSGEHAPGLKNFKDSLLAAHHLLYSHGLAVQTFRDGDLLVRLESPEFNSSISSGDKAEDMEAAQRLTDLITDGTWIPY